MRDINIDLPGNTLQLSVIALAVLLIASGGIAHGVAIQDEDEEPPKPAPNGSVPPEGMVYGESYYGVPAEEAIFFWNLRPLTGDVKEDFDIEAFDPDEALDGVDEEEIEDGEYNDELTDEEMTLLLRAQAAAHDWSTRELPGSITWNKQNFDAFTVISDEDKSHHPGGVEDGERIKAAHASIFDIHKSVITYAEPGDIQWYIPRDGDVFGMVDYYIDVPETEWIVDNDYMKYKTEYELANHTVDEACILNSGKEGVNDDDLTCDNSNIVLGEGNGSVLEEISYEIPNNKDIDKIRFNANITANISWTGKKKVYECVNSSDPSTCGWTEWEVDDEGVDRHDMKVYDERRIEHWDGDLHARVDRVEYPNGTVDFRVRFETNAGELPPASWSYIDLNGTRVNSEWSYVTWRNPLWDKMALTMEGGSSEYYPTAAPIFTNAVPVGEPKPEYPETEPNTILYTDGSGNLTSPNGTLPSTVNIDLIEDSYTPTTEIVIRHSDETLSDDISGLNEGEMGQTTGSYNASAVTLGDVSIGAVLPATETEVIENSDRIVRETQLNATIIEETSNGGHIVEIEFVDGDGSPIDLTKSDRGQILVNNETEVETDATGTATVELPPGTRGRIAVEYNPPTWYEVPTDTTLYNPAKTHVRVAYGHDINSFIRFILDTLLLPVIALGVVYGWIRRDVFLKHL